MMITYWEKIYLYTCLTIIALGCMFLGYWYLWPVKVIEIKNPGAVKVNKEIYQAGDRITYTLDYCKFKNVSGIVLRTLVNGTKQNFTEVHNNISVGCKSFNNSELVIPEFVDSGTYHIETTVKYNVNPLKTVYVSWRSVDFKVENNVLNKIEIHDEEDQVKFKSLQNQINRID